ncbi:substrate-binding domain-containing protein [Microbacteriaceae bacterium VKM Ac-2855]|nr:substrate-binding domain-containing protein [Microbacteriaceae bacterium VKM Ac-2855]
MFRSIHPGARVRPIARILAGAAAFAAAAVVLSGCSSAAGAASSVDSEYLVPTKDDALVVGLANSFGGDAWRTQMVYELQGAVDRAPEDFERLIVTDANNSIDKQISDINDLLSQGVDVLLIDAGSETALNASIQRAWQQGVLVVSFDGTASSPHNITVNPDQSEFGKISGDWLASKLQAGDGVFTLDGIAGNPTSELRLAAGTAALDAAGIEIVGGTAGDWDRAKGQSAASDLLTANPDVAGIFSQGGSMSLGAINVLEQRGMDLIPIPGEGYNGFLKKWKELKDSVGWESIAPSQSPSISVDALDVALRAIRGEDPGQKVVMDLPVITQDNLEDYVRTDLPDDFWVPTKMTDDQLTAYFNR